MNWTKLAEDRIAEAIANGEFDNLPGQGKPLDLADYFALPAAERAGTALLKNANVVPPEVQLLKEIAELEKAIVFHSDSPRVARLREQLQEKRVAFSMSMERRRRREPRAVE
jgi:hypothetical protein